jgi:tRNA(fMet)-specific endonuclease VapC
MLWILDTDCLSLFQTGNAQLVNRIDQLPFEQISTTVITAEEQMRGRLNIVRRAENQRKLSGAYGFLRESILFFHRIQVLEFTPEAEIIYWQLKAQKIRPGSRDLKISALAKPLLWRIALSLDATVITRNRKDFQQVPNLKFEDWSV